MPALLIIYIYCLIAFTLSGFLWRCIFTAYNLAHFAELPFKGLLYALFWGLRFDLATAAALALLVVGPYWIKIRFLKRTDPPDLLLSLTLISLIIMQAGDIIYFVDAGRHVSYEVRDALSSASSLMLYALDGHLIFIIVSIVLILVQLRILIAFRPIPPADNSSDKSILASLRNEASMFAVLVISVLLIRGGLGGVPQSPLSAYKIGNSLEAVIAMNGAYSVVHGAINSSRDVRRVNVTLPEGTDVTASMQELYPHLTTASGIPRHEYNLIFVFLEGWPAELMASYGFDRETTPFFDTLLKQSLAPRAVIAGGHRTTEGLYASLCSQQNPLGQTIAQTNLQNFDYDCLPDILRSRGWSTAFFQGTYKDTSGTGAFAQKLGFTDSFGKEDMTDAHYPYNEWGAHDPDIYDFILEKLDDMPRPFFVGVNTNSTHSTELPDGVTAHFGDTTELDKKISVLHFADAALGEFFEKLKQRGHLEDTIIIMMSDHTSGRSYNRFATYMIPGAIVVPDIEQPYRVNRYVSQRDIAPTVLDLMGMEPELTFSGKSFARDKPGVHFADFYDTGNIHWLLDDTMIRSNVAKPGEIRCYDIRHSLLNAKQIQCNSDALAESARSLSFTSWSQGLLFDGKTGDFFSFMDTGSKP